MADLPRWARPPAAALLAGQLALGAAALGAGIACDSPVPGTTSATDTGTPPGTATATSSGTGPSSGSGTSATPARVSRTPALAPLAAPAAQLGP